MKVKQLIKDLQQYADPDMEVMILVTSGGTYWDVSTTHISDEARTDPFDDNDISVEEVFVICI